MAISGAKGRPFCSPLRSFEETSHLVLENVMPLLEVHHVAAVRDDDVPLVRVGKLLEEGEATAEVGHVVVFAVDDHYGDGHEPGVEHGHEGDHNMVSSSPGELRPTWGLH